MKKKDRNFSTVHAEINGFVSRVSEAVARSLNGGIVAFPPFENDDKKKKKRIAHSIFQSRLRKFPDGKADAADKIFQSSTPPPPPLLTLESHYLPRTQTKFLTNGDDRERKTEKKC